MTGNRHFAPIHTFSVLQEPGPDGTLVGIAAPVSGVKPCALELTAGSTAVARIAAIDFSSAALERGLRQGWCSFTIGGFEQALASGGSIELRCVASGQPQMRWDAAVLARQLARSAREYLTVSDLRKRLQRPGSCTDVKQVIPFALALARASGVGPFLEATYSYLLGRLPDQGGLSAFSSRPNGPEAVEECWTTIMNSEEGKLAGHRPLLGPFQPSFPFPLAALDAPPLTTAEVAS